jgi:cell division protein FtsW
MLRRTRHLFIPLLPGFVLIVGLVMLEPDLGTTCCLIMILLGLLWTIGMPLRYFAGVVIVLIIGVLALALAAPYRWQRVTTFLHPFQDIQTTGYHTVEGLYAIASGGFFGVGLGQGTSKYGWVPNANSDYVFAIIGEETGLLGCAFVLALFGFFAYTGLRVSRRSVDPFVRLVCGAATIWLCGQAIINIGYVTGLLPVTGIPLPFISAGGTSLLVSFLVLGMLVSFARHEAPAVAEVRRAIRSGRRSRLQRWLRIPVPRAYVPPRRRKVSDAPARKPAAAPVARGRTAPTRPARTSAGLRPTGTEGRRR